MTGTVLTDAIEAGTGEVLVLVHGVGMQAIAWQPQIAALSRTHRVIAVNMPGHVGTPGLPPGADLPQFVGWLAAGIAGLGPVNVAGHSMGAMVALGLAATRPELVRRVALLNGVFRRSDAARVAVLARAEALAHGRIDVEAPLARWFPDAQDQGVRAQVRGWLAEVDPKGYAAAYRAFAGGDATYADALGTIKCPFLALTGAEDANSTSEMARAMAEIAPCGVACVIEGHGHMVNLTAAEAVTEALRTWLATPIAPEKEMRT